MLLTASFLSYTLEVSFIFIGWSFPTQFGVHFLPLVVEDSWEDYIYSLPTLYNTLLPYAINKVISVLACHFDLAFTDFSRFIQGNPSFVVFTYIIFKIFYYNYIFFLFPLFDYLTVERFLLTLSSTSKIHNVIIMNHCEYQYLLKQF